MKQIMARRRLRLLAVGILLIGCAVLLSWYTGASSRPPQEEAAQQRTPAVPTRAAEPASSPSARNADVQVAAPTRRDLTYVVTLPANVAPLYQTTLYAKVSGYLKWIGPDKGDSVKKDQVVAIIDAPEVEQQYRQAMADFKIKKLTHERLASVFHEAPDVIAKQDVDVAEAAFEGSRHLLQQVTVLHAYTKVRAPYNGIITARFADPGALIQVATASATGAIPLFTIMDIETVRVYMNVSQEDAPLVKPGVTAAVLTVREHPGRQFKGMVTRSTLALDPATRTMLVEVDLPNRDHALQPGTFGEISLALRHSPNALSIPAGAIVSNGKVKSVFIVDQGKARLAPIQTGISDGRMVEVVEGLTGNEAVVVVGKGKLTEGMTVDASPYNLPEGTPAAQKFETRTSGAAPVRGSPPPPR
jgi:RND family efflux transporter MFP subunit